MASPSTLRGVASDIYAGMGQISNYGTAGTQVSTRNFAATQRMAVKGLVFNLVADLDTSGTGHTFDVFVNNATSFPLVVSNDGFRGQTHQFGLEEVQLFEGDSFVVRSTGGEHADDTDECVVTAIVSLR